jgi:hypothetical protein
VRSPEVDDCVRDQRRLAEGTDQRDGGDTDLDCVSMVWLTGVDVQ